MRYRLLVFFLAIFVHVSVPALAQYEQMWALGISGGLDFRDGAPKPFLTNMGVYPGTNYSAFGEGCASVCDASGALLFYSEGFYVWDRNGNAMPNGKELVPLNGLNLRYTPTSSTSQGVLIVPMPENDGKYYLFSLTAKEAWQKRGGELYYSIIDMSLNGGLGDVVANSKSTFVDSLLGEKMTATKGDHCNIWLLASGVSATSANFKAYEITAAGMNASAVVSNTGIGSIIAPFGTICVAPNGKKVIATQGASWGGRKGAAIFDFDISTGLFSNKMELLDCCGGYGAAFSPNSRLVYVVTYNSTIYQYNLQSNDPAAIVASEMLLGSASFSHAKLAPDGKIYFVSMKSGQLGVINFPDSVGKACNYQDAAVTMLPGQKLYAGLPNTVVYLPFKATQSMELPKGDCWANVNGLNLTAKFTTRGWDYIWNDGVTGMSRTVNQPGIYWVSYKTPPCDKYTDTFYVSFPNGVLPDMHAQAACNGASNGQAWATTFPGDTVDYHYLWRNKNGDTLSISDTLKGQPSATYTLQIRTASCDTLLSFLLPEEKIAVAFTADSIVCQGTVLSFENRSDQEFTKFHWDFGAKDTSSLRDPSYVFVQAGQYQVTLKGVGGRCVDSVAHTIVVDSLYSGKFLMQPDSICMGESIVFSTLADSSAARLLWDFGRGLETASQYVSSLQHAFDRAGAIPVSLTLQFRACPPSLYTDTVYVGAFPDVDLGPDSFLCLHNSALVLQNRKSKSGEDFFYMWNTGATTETLSVVHPGDYALRLTTKHFGCASTSSVTVRKNCYIDIPNAFTPNGDGFNDFFFPRQLLTKKIHDFKMMIWNRYGQVVFDTEQGNGRGWDGKFNGLDQPAGVYVYRIDMGLPGSTAELYEGNVTLLR